MIILMTKPEFVWFGITAFLLSLIAIVIIWSFRNRQFSDQKRAAYLPLESYIPEKKDEIKEKENA